MTSFSKGVDFEFASLAPMSATTAFNVSRSWSLRRMTGQWRKTEVLLKIFSWNLITDKIFLYHWLMRMISSFGDYSGSMSWSFTATMVINHSCIGFWRLNLEKEEIVWLLYFTMLFHDWSNQRQPIYNIVLRLCSRSRQKYNHDTFLPLAFRNIQRDCNSSFSSSGTLILCCDWNFAYFRRKVQRYENVYTPQEYVQLLIKEAK